MNIHSSVLAVCPCHAYAGSSFETSITDYNAIELSYKPFTVGVRHTPDRAAKLVFEALAKLVEKH